MKLAIGPRESNFDAVEYEESGLEGDSVACVFRDDNV